MNFSELQESLYGIRSQITALSEMHTNLKEKYSIESIPFEEGYRIKGVWRCSPESGISYKLEFISKEDGLLCECFDGSLYKRQEMPPEIEARCKSIHRSLLDWFEDKTPWPFEEDNF